MSTVKEISRSEEQAKAQFESIKEMVNALHDENEVNKVYCSKSIRNGKEDALQTILEDALSVEIRTEWYIPGNKPEPGEYTILLCTGGPACRIIGELNEYREPETARIEHQDWGTYWKEYIQDEEAQEILLKYARCFYFGE